MKETKASIKVSNITIEWDTETGTCHFEKLPVAMMWVDTTLSGLMAGVQTMVGTERFGLALQSEGRKSVEADWQVISRFPEFEDGFKAIATIAAVAGWGQWTIFSLDREKSECTIRVSGSWESQYQKTLGVCWGSGMLAGKMAGYCSKLFGTNCWAEQTTFSAIGDIYDTFVVKPSPKTIEHEIDTLLLSDSATRADMAVALSKLRIEVDARLTAEKLLRKNQEELEIRVEQRTSELKASEEKFRSIIESSPMGIHLYELTLAGDLLFCGYNPAADRMLGIDHRQFLGKDIISAFPNIENTAVPNKYREICESGIPWQTEQINYQDEKINGAFEVHAFQTSKGKVAVFFLDITKKLKDEENVRLLEKQIQQVRNIESLGVLAGGIAHDFNNILTGIIGNLSLASHMLPVSGEVHALIKEAENASLRARDLTHQLLTFARGGDPITQTASMTEVITESAQFVLRGSSVACTFNIVDDLWLVKVDKNQMSQVIQNIILNAKQAMPGGGTIVILGENLDSVSHEKVLLLHDQPYIKISITDQGAGIPETILHKIFEPYFTTKQHGTGLGLAITHSIITRHQGFIDVDSKEGKGSTFHIYLPAQQKSTITTVKTVDVAQQKKLRVLVMDDEPIVKLVLSTLLREMGHLVTISSEGSEAVRIYREHPDQFDCVIMDLTVPGGMGGREATLEILKINPKACVIVSSGYSNDPIIAHYKEYGFSAALKKPYQYQELKRMLGALSFCR